MQGHIAISAHTVGTIVVIDESGSELRAFPTNHLGQQVGTNSLIASGFSLQCINYHSQLAASSLEGTPSEVGLWAISLSPP